MPSRKRRFKTSIYEQFARIGKALSSPSRLELLDLLCQGPRTVDALATEAGLGLANTSQHLRALREARLVDAEKAGLFVTYRVADEQVRRFYLSLRTLAEAQLAEVGEMTRRYLRERDSLQPVDRRQLLGRVRRGAVTVLDVRPAKEYAAGHLPGAISVPLKQLKRRLAELPRDREIVAYCRGPYCVLAVEAVEVLTARGFTAFRLEDSVADWQARGLPVEMGAVESHKARIAGR
jgi:rhodanese-related sulfurtransferase/DNA-binding transcriptional ArsR family regulator